MRLRQSIIFIHLMVCFIFYTTINAQDQTANPDDNKKESKLSTTVLFERAIDATMGNKENWISALIEAGLEFKLSAIDGLRLIDPEVVSREVKGHNDLQQIPSDDEYLRAAKKLKADYIVNQKYELSKSGSVEYYAEIISVSDGQLFKTVEKTFKLDGFGLALDEIVGSYLVELNIAQPKELARFLRLSAFGSNIKFATKLGELIIKERYEKGADAEQISVEYRNLCEKDRSLLLAYYRGGLFFEIIGKLSDASEALNILFMTIPEYKPVYVPLTRIFKKNKRYEDAIRIAKLGLKRGIKSSELSSELAQAYSAMGNKVEAESVFKTILENDPDDPFALLSNARKNNNEGKAQDALKLGDRLLSLNSNSERGWAQVERGRSLMVLGRNDEAIAAFNEATSLLPSEADPVVYLGDLYKTTGQYQKAFQQYEKILKRTTDNIDLYINAAEMAKKAGDSRKALSLLYTIESRFTNHGGLQSQIGILELSTGDSSKARIHLEAGARAGVENEDLLTGLGWIYIKSKEYDKAITSFLKVLSKAKDQDQIRAGLVVAYLKKGDASSALTMLGSMKSGQNSISDLNRMLGDAYLKKDQNDKALIYYRKEATLISGDTSLQSVIAELSYNSEPAPSAINEYNKLVKMGAGGANAYYRLAILSLKQKDNKSADVFTEKAKQAGNADVNTWYQIGVEYSNLGIKSKAQDAFAECIKIDPSMKVGGSEMAELLKKSGKDSAAAETYLKLYEKNKNGEHLLLAAQLFDKGNVTSSAIKTYSTAFDKKIIDTKGIIRLAELEFEKKNFGRTITLLESLSPANINNKEAKLLAESYFALGKFDKAVSHLVFMQSKDPKDVRVIELSARVHDTLGNHGDAIKMYLKYITSAGKNTDYAFRIGELYEKLKNSDLAISQYSDNIKFYPEDFRNFDRLSRLYVESNKMASAIPVLKRAVNFKEAKSDLNELLARALAVQGSGGEAIAQYQTYLESNKNDYDSWVKLGTLCYTQKKYNDAVQALEKAVAIKNSDLSVLKMLGHSYFSLSKTDEAVSVLTKARNIKRGDSEILSILAECFRASGSTKNLIDVLSEIVGNDKNAYDLRVELGELLVKEGKASDAIAVYEAAVLLRKCQINLHLQLARLYEQTKNDERWLNQIKAATVCSPKDPNLNMELGKYYFNKKEYSKADGYLRNAISANSKLHEAHYLLGNSLQKQNKFADSHVYLQKAVQIEPKNVEYRFALADVLYRQGKTMDALGLIRPIISTPNLAPSVLSIAGLIYKAAGNEDTARQILENAIMSNPSCWECFAALGDLHFDKAVYSEAAKAYQKAFDIGSVDDALAGKLATSYLKLNKNDQAQKLLEKIVQSSPGNGEAIYRLCHLYITQNQLINVRKLKNASTTPKNGWYYLIEGELYEAEGNINSATVSYTKALKTLPQVSEVQAGCGRISLIKKQYSNAITYIGQAMAGDPENVLLFMELGKAYEGSGDLMTAMELYKDVETRMPDHSEVHYYMARIHSRNNDHDNAINTLLKGIERNKKNYLMYIALGHEYKILKQTDKAIDAYLRAVKIDESKAFDGYKHIGNIYYSIDEKKAKKYYEMYVNAGGKDPKIKKIIGQ